MSDKTYFFQTSGGDISISRELHQFVELSDGPGTEGGIHLLGFINSDAEENLVKRFRHYCIVGRWFRPSAALLAYIRTNIPDAKININAVRRAVATRAVDDKIEEDARARAYMKTQEYIGRTGLDPADPDYLEPLPQDPRFRKKKKSEPFERTILKPGEVAIELGISAARLRTLVKNKQIEAMVYGKTIRYLASAVKACKEKLMREV